MTQSYVKGRSRLNCLCSAFILLVVVAMTAAVRTDIVTAQVRDRPKAGLPLEKTQKSDEQQSADDEKYLPCDQGPSALKQIDVWERQGLSAKTELFGRPSSPESAAEVLIADCAEQLAKISMAAGLVKDSPLRAIVNVWQTNLDFMKWWLQNRRQKMERP